MSQIPDLPDPKAVAPLETDENFLISTFWDITTHQLDINLRHLGDVLQYGAQSDAPRKLLKNQTVAVDADCECSVRPASTATAAITPNRVPSAA